MNSSSPSLLAFLQQIFLRINRQTRPRRKRDTKAVRSVCYLPVWGCRDYAFMQHGRLNGVLSSSLPSPFLSFFFFLSFFLPSSFSSFLPSSPWRYSHAVASSSSHHSLVLTNSCHPLPPFYSSPLFLPAALVSRQRRIYVVISRFLVLWPPLRAHYFIPLNPCDIYTRLNRDEFSPLFHPPSAFLARSSTDFSFDCPGCPRNDVILGRKGEKGVFLVLWGERTRKT